MKKTIKKIGLGDYRTNPAIIENVVEVLESGRVSYGSKTADLEETWAAIHQARHAIVVSSGTAALHASLWSSKIHYGWPDGAEVIVPAVTFVATVNAVLHCNLKPVFVDVEPHTALIRTLPPGAPLRAAINKNTVAILPVHLFGQAANMTEVMSAAHDNDLIVIEDCCEAFAAKQGGRTVGSFGKFGCFSTYVAHHIPAGGGGVITTNDTALADLARSVVNHGRDTRYWSVDMGTAIPEIKFRFPYVGFNYRSTEILSAVTLGLTRDWEESVERRRRIAEIYDETIGDYARGTGSKKMMVTHEEEGNYHTWMMYPFIFYPAQHNPSLKFDLMGKLEKRGIDCREALPLLTNPAYGYLKDQTNVDIDNHPYAKMWHSAGLYIPCHQYMDESDAYYIADMVINLVQEM